MSVLCFDDTIGARRLSINGSIAMHLNQIKSFITVSQVLNFTNAARQNGVPQSTISRQINDLEQQLGVKLFYRTRRDVRLTQEGRAFLPYAQEILDAAKKGAFAVKQLHEGAEGRLSIATIDDSDRFLTQCLREFSRKYPGIVVDLTYVSHGEPLQSEVDDPYDFHFHYLDMIPDSEEYEVIETHTSQLCFVSPKRDDGGASGAAGKYDASGQPSAAGGSDAAGRPEATNGADSAGGPQSAVGPGTAACPDNGLDLATLPQEKFILISEEENPILYMQVMNYCQTHRFTPQVANRFSDVKSVLLSVGSGLGISILPAEVAAIVASLPETRIQVTPIDDENYAITCAVAWKKSLLNPAAELFLKVMEEQLG